MSRINTRLQTCRYWALGRCPNFNSQGVSICEYAHFDTGRLGSHVDQRGTCKFWLKNRCSNGENCIYEHRYTGTPGLYQGVVDLNGIDFEIANAASRSGFNTFNHAALFDLIWSIKKVARRNDQPRRPSMTKHAIYPDRYRPSGVGDNTKRKRVFPDADPPPFYPVPLLKRREPGIRKKIATVHSKSNMAIKKTSEAGSRATPICLDSDDEKPSADISAKRLKLNDGRAVHPVLKLTLESQTSSCKIEQATTAVSKNNILPRTGRSAGPSRTITDVSTRLREAHVAMSTHQDIIEECREKMVAHFNHHANTYFDNQEAMRLVRAVADGVFRAADGLKSATTEADKLVHWMEEAVDEKNQIL